MVDAAVLPQMHRGAGTVSTNRPRQWTPLYQTEAARRLVTVADILKLPERDPVRVAAEAIRDPGDLPEESQFGLALLVGAILGKRQP